MSGIVAYNKILHDTLPLERVVSKSRAFWMEIVIDIHGRYEDKFHIFYRPAAHATTIDS